ncbi:caspase domain-containing protein, partial [Schizophyllum commune]
DQTTIAAMSDSDASSGLEQYSTSSASSSSSSLVPVTDVRGLHRRQLSDSLSQVRDALVVPLHIALAMVEAKFVSSKCIGRKKAVCIGINYIDEPSENAIARGFTKLTGCIQDTRDIQEYLMADEGFEEANIRVLTDEDKTPADMKPTRDNVLAAMRWLLEGAQQDDTLFFHYAGHGTQVADQNGDEVDHLDEALVPCGYQNISDLITDDEIHERLVVPLPAGCRLTRTVQSCTSGTVLDLPFVYRAHLCQWLHRKESVEHRPQAFTRREMLLSCPDVVSWSGCKDSHVAADSKTMTKVSRHASLFAVRSFDVCSSSATLTLHSQRVSDILLNGKERQKPQFGTYYPVDMHAPFFITSPAS